MRFSKMLSLVFLAPYSAAALAADSATGTAIVRVADAEYTIPITCDELAHPENGLFTEPSRITRERTGRSSGIRLTIRPWKETDYVVVSLDRYVAWIPRQETGDGTLNLTLGMSAASTLKDGVPKALTFEDWMAGDRPAGLDSVTIEADCNVLYSDAPSFRKLK